MRFHSTSKCSKWSSETWREKSAVLLWKVTSVEHDWILEGTDCEGAWGALALFIHPRWKEWKNPLCEFVFECMHYWTVCGTQECHFALVAVQLHCDLLWLWPHRETSAGRCLCPVGVTALSNYPVSLSWVQKDCVLSVGRLTGNPYVPVGAFSHIYIPGVFPRSEATRCKHRRSAAAALIVVRHRALFPIMHTAELIGEDEVSLCCIWIQIQRTWKENVSVKHLICTTWNNCGDLKHLNIVTFTHSDYFPNSMCTQKSL